MSGLQQVVPGGILHGDFLTGQAGKPCNVAAAAQDAQRAAVGLLSMGGESGSLLGDALALIGAAFIAGHWLTSRAARRNLPALGFMTFVYGVTAVFLLLISPFAGGLAVTGESLYGIIVLAVACTLGGHALMTYLLGFVSADVVSFALLAEPIGAAVWALLLFHEKVTPPLMIGGLTVIVGLMHK